MDPLYKNDRDHHSQAAFYRDLQPKPINRGEKIPVCFSSGIGCPKRGKPAIALRRLFNSSRNERSTASSPPISIAVCSGALCNIPCPRIWLNFRLERSKYFIQETGWQFFAWRDRAGQNVELVADRSEQRFHFGVHVVEKPCLSSVPAEIETGVKQVGQRDHKRVIVCQTCGKNSGFSRSC